MNLIFTLALSAVIFSNAESRTISAALGEVEVIVNDDSSLMFRNNSNGELLLGQALSDSFGNSSSWARITISNWHGISLSRYIYEGWSFPFGESTKIATAQKLLSSNIDGDSLSVLFATDYPGLRVQAKFSQVSMRDNIRHHNILAAKFTIISMNHSSSLTFNRLGIGFIANDNAANLASKNASLEGFYGFGERFLPGNQRGNNVYCWAEDGGWGFGTELRLPKGPESTYMPMPWLIARRPGGLSYGLFINSTYRTNWNLGAPQQSTLDEVAGVCGISVLHRDTPSKSIFERLYRMAMSKDVYCHHNQPIISSGYTTTIEDAELPIILIFGGTPANILKLFTELQLTNSELSGYADLDKRSPERTSLRGDKSATHRVSTKSVQSSGKLLNFSRSLIPPPHMFGPWNQFAHEFTNITDQLVAAKMFRQMDIPSSIAIDPVHFFPDGSQRGQEVQLKARNEHYRALGYKTLCYFNSMIDTRYHTAFNHSLTHDYLVKWDIPKKTRHESGITTTGGAVGPNGTYLFAYKGAGANPFFCGLIDLTNPAAVDWYQQQFDEGISLGYGGWMYDYGEYVDPNTTFYTGGTGDELHNAYPLIYQKAAWDYFQTLVSDTDVVSAEQVHKGRVLSAQLSSNQYYTPPFDFHFSYGPNYFYYVRSGYSGTQSTQFSAWTGDPSSDWTHHSGLPAQISAMLNVGLSGVGFIGSDIGGFLWLEPPSPELWMRWTEVGAFSGTMHIQGGGTSFFGIPKTTIHDTKEGSFVWRKFAKLRTALFPYIYSAAHEYQVTGLPLMRHHLISFPWDDIAVDQSYQWMFGSAFLVAPVISNNTFIQDVYLPRLLRADSNPVGAWIDFNTAMTYDTSSGRFRISGVQTVLQGGEWIKSDASIDVIPTFVRSGSIVATIDPSVQTLVTTASPPVPPGAASGGSNISVLSYDDRSNITHLWAFCHDILFLEKTSMQLAYGWTWDGAVYSISSLGHSSSGNATILFTITDPYGFNRTNIAQIALPGGLKKVFYILEIGHSSSEVMRVQSYSDLLWVIDSNPQSPSTAFATYSKDSDGIVDVLYLRVGPSSTDELSSIDYTSRQFKIYIAP